MMKDKRRNSEKRKEKSRDAARCRRSKESEVFSELADCLPLPSSIISQLDKASTMRLLISYLKIQKILTHDVWSDEGKDEYQQELDQLLPKALDGFFFILSRDGDIIHITETVVKYLGIQQIDMMGQSFFDFCDPRDEDEIREALSVRLHGNESEPSRRVFFIRMKCTLTSKGRNVNLKSASFKVIRCSGQVLQTADMQQTGSFPYLMAVGEPIPDPANIEVPLDSFTFLSKHDMNMKFTFCDESVMDLLNYSAEDLVGKSLFDFHHAMDSGVVEKAFKDLLSKGQTMTGHYRFLAQGGGWARVITQATVINNHRNHKAQWIVCVHHVITKVEKPGVVLSMVQQKPQKVEESPEKLLDITPMESIFSPKAPDTKDTYFYPPWVDHMEKKSTNEPDHLTFLSPKSGEVGVALSTEDAWQAYQADKSKQFLQGEEAAKLAPTSTAVMVEGLKQEPGLCPTFCHMQDKWTRGNCPASSSSSSSCVSPCSSSSSSRMGSPRDYGNAINPVIIDSMDDFFHTLDMKCDPLKEESTKYEGEILGIEHRAPSVQGHTACDMSGPSKDFMLTYQNAVNPAVLYGTDNIFRPRFDNIFDEPPTPPRPSLRDMMCGSPTVASIEQPPDIMFKQRKRPLDMNSLEKGPPISKCSRFVGQQPPSLQVPQVRSQNTLLNLLLKGADHNGYRPTPQQLATKGDICEELFSPLSCLNQQDCEVNAPIQSSSLLNGEDLLMALDTAMPPMSLPVSR